MKSKEPGFPGLDVPGPNELLPFPQDHDPSRGPLAGVPIGTQMIHDFSGAPRDVYGGDTKAPTTSASTMKPDEDSSAKGNPKRTT